jgi:DNA-binding MarR family transcriptional regulator
MSQNQNALAVALFSEIFATDILARNRLSRALPKGMELNQFSVLNHLSRLGEERTPAQLAKIFNVTRGAITNTLAKLEWAGYVHIRPDWDDARRKMVSVSPSGKVACEAAIEAIAPVLAATMEQIGPDKVRALLPVMRELRIKLAELE